MKKVCLFVSILTIVAIIACSSKSDNNITGGGGTGPGPGTGTEKDTVYNETGCLYTSYNKLVMAGYQGWFAAVGDESNRGWYHLQNGSCGGFLPGCASVDMWPDVSEYTKTYKTPFKFADGKDAFMYSPYDESTIDLHFKWMKDYGIDGVFMQRFVVEIKKSNPAGKRHFNKVLQNALIAAKKYDRAICVMYDLSGCNSADVAYIQEDWNELVNTFKLFSNTDNPTYLRHNKRPLVVLWGVGFNDNRQYSISDVDKLVTNLKGKNNRVSLMLGVPYYWRTMRNDTENSPSLHPLIKRADIVMPWAVGRYNNNNYAQVAGGELVGDLQWCNTNNITYVPLVFPGFSWGNLKNDPASYNSIPREKGDFLWKQMAGAKMSGAQSLYVAMFDEIDEGTAIYKCLQEGNLPLNGSKKFVGIESDVAPDYYLWLTGQAGKWMRGEGTYGATKPTR
ncbi:hypothetical protein LX64_03416 [Chitinophaga skermanii]|uniref:Glycosyl hydrolase family 99 n=1 Tax=Chitinophaga skermanii TaxID=331697 RepID=A0A327QGF6_9BACT|nr:glycoside hydrolase family 71/99-like protein [Chitinophaga skermanii]RAJ02403.1 hypothetical protein LX64_03416 [Chitinophaga skermanii]